MDRKLVEQQQPNFGDRWAPATSGVPHGAVLGTLLFIVYTKDVDVRFNSFISKFSDAQRMEIWLLVMKTDKASRKN